MSAALKAALAFLLIAPAGQGRGDESAVRSIRRLYASINRNAPRYRRVKKELSGFSTEGGELTAYFDGPAVVKLAADYYGETGRAAEEFYFAGGRLIFVYRKEETYDAPLSGKVAATREQRFYFAGERLIRWVKEDGRRAPPASDEFAEKQADYLRLSRKLTAGARSPAPTIGDDN